MCLNIIRQCMKGGDMALVLKLWTQRVKILHYNCTNYVCKRQHQQVVTPIELPDKKPPTLQQPATKKKRTATFEKVF